MKRWPGKLTPFGRPDQPIRKHAVPTTVSASGVKALPLRKMLSGMLSLCLLAGSVQQGPSGAPRGDLATEGRLTRISLEDLGKLEVTTASKEPVQAARTPAAIFVITQEDIRRSGATSIPEVLRLAPGVEVARIDSSKWSIGVRGFQSRLSRSVLVLVDGRSVYTPLFAGVYWEVQDTLLQDIDRIEIIRGPGGTIWGANAVNAVINIITKSAKDTQGMIVTAGGGNIDQGTVGFRYGVANGKNLSFRIYGKASSRGLEFHPDGGRFDDWRMGQGGFRADWNSHSRDTLTFQGDLYKGDAGERLSITNYSPPSTVIVEQNAKLSGGNLLGRWQRKLDSGSDSQLQVYYDRTNHQEASFGENRDTFDVDFIHLLTLPRRQKLSWGLGTRISSGNVIQKIPTIQFIPNHHTEKLFSAFIQDDFPLVGNVLWLTIGTKLLHNEYSGFEAQPGMRLLWTPNERQSVWGSITRAVRTPSRVETDLEVTGLSTPTPPTFFRLVGNRQFHSEDLLGYEMGYRGLVKQKFFFDFAAFFNSYDRLLGIETGTPFSEPTPAPAHTVIPLVLRNSVQGATTGFEIATDWTPLERWRVKSSYSYLHLDFKRRPGSLDLSTARSIERGSPHHLVMIQSFLDLPKKLEFDQTFRYVSAVPAQLVGRYATADVRLGWRPIQTVEFSISGQNLLQPHHGEFRGDPGALVGIKRSFYAKITWTR